MKVTKIDAQTRAKFVSEKAEGLPAHFARIREGSEPTGRTPLFKGRSAEEVVAEWKTILSRYSGSYPRLVEYDLSRLPKFGPQGGYPPMSDRMRDLELYFTNTMPVSLPPAVRQRLVLQTRDYLFGKEHSKRPLPVASVLKRDIAEDKVNTSSGLPDFRKRSHPDIQQKAVKDAESGMWSSYPSVIGSRSQRMKVRFIFMSPMSSNLNGKRFLLPLMDIIRSRNVLSFSAWEGFEDVEKAIHQQDPNHSSLIYMNYDFEKMDTTVGRAQTELVHEVIAPIFQPQYRDALKESMLYGNLCKVMIDNHLLIEGDHGYASGVEWVNFVESVLSLMVQLRFEELSGEPLVISQLLGDDGAISMINEVSNAGELMLDVFNEFGFKGQAEKQAESKHTFVYLQRFFDRDILIPGTNVMAGSYPTVLALNTAMNPERFHDPGKWNNRMEILRWIMILENCHHHPAFEDLVKFFVRGDSFGLGTKIPSYFGATLKSDYKVAKTITGFVPSYTQAHKEKGIMEYDTVKLLQRLAKSSK
jgi:hypothetical protein